MALSQETTTLAQELIAGAVKVFANAESLFTEATLLANAEAWARALFLHQISLEECAKIEMLAAATTQLLMGHAVNLAPLRRAFSRHESKNRVNAYFLPTTEQEVTAREQGDFAAAIREFEQLQDSFHKDSNTDKNASLYVDFGDTFSSPLDLIDEPTFLRVRLRNEEFMALTLPKVEMLKRWLNDLEAAAAEVNEVMSEMDFSALERGNAEQFTAFTAGFDAKLEAIAKRRKASQS
jgi:AbiV family abortive infection protein